jgi:TetR/AcrR family transcriptional repressor of nem operon
VGRPRSYDPDAVLEAALTTFWERGYEATSIEDLVQATGVNRFGLYQQWRDKRGLLLACLERYTREAFGGLLARLAEEGAGLAEVEAVFTQLAAFVTAPEGSRSCLVLNSVVELGQHDPDLFRTLRGYLDELQGAFALALTHAQARGELSPEAQIEAHAAHLAVSLQALLLQGRARPAPATVHHFVRLTLSTLERA